MNASMMTEPRDAAAVADLEDTAQERPPREGRLDRLARVRAETWVTLIVVGGCCAFTLAQLHPELIFSNTTPSGGDMGAHVWGPAYLRDVLLPSGRLSGWSADWYAGFPAYQFYMVVPSLVIVALDVVLPYGIAFKLVTVSGVIALPVCAWSFGKLARLPFPTPPLLAAGATAFLFDRSFSIYGGNIASTLAGEFAFTMSLALAILYLGVVARGLQNGRHRGWAAVLLALCGLCHLIPAFFAVAGTAIWFVIWSFRDGIRVRRGSAFVPWVALFVAAAIAVQFGRSWPPIVLGALVIGLPAAILIGFFGLDRRAVRSHGSSAGQFLPAATRSRMIWLVTVTPVAALLSSFWVLPFYARQVVPCAISIVFCLVTWAPSINTVTSETFVSISFSLISCPKILLKIRLNKIRFKAFIFWFYCVFRYRFRLFLILRRANSFIHNFFLRQSASWRTNWRCYNNEPQPEKPLKPALK
jgi:hypothetical protein